MATFDNSYVGETLPAIFYPEHTSSLGPQMDYESMPWEQLSVTNSMLEKSFKRSDSYLDLVSSASPKDRALSSGYDGLNSLVSSVYPPPPQNATIDMKYYPSQPSSRKSSSSPPDSHSYAAPQDYFSGCHHDHGNSQLPPGENHVCPATTHKLKRREQNRASQRAFRQRQITYVKGLELKLSKLTTNYENLQKKYEKLCREHSITPSSPEEEEELDAPSETVDGDADA